MAATTPLAVGTRGTVGSLVRKEIEYFTKLDTERRGGSRGGPVRMASGRGYSRPSFWLLIMAWRKKKRPGSSSFLLRFCSAAKVAETKQLNKIPGFDYEILNNDNNLKV